MPFPAAGLSPSVNPYEVVVIKAEQKTLLEETGIILRKADGNIFPLTSAAHTVRFIAKEWITDEDKYLNIVCTVASDGTVSLTIPDTSLTLPGMFFASFDITRKTDNKIVKRIPAYLNVEPALSEVQQYTPWTLGQVRQSLMDRGSEDNFLIDDTEFSDGLIIQSVLKSVSVWNSTPPEDGNYTYTQVTFPDQSLLEDGINGYILKSVALNLTRNRLASNTGGISVDDKQRADPYMKLSEMYLDRFNTAIMKQKYIQGIDGWYRTVRHPAFG